MDEQTLREEWEYYYPKVYGYFFRRVNNRLDVEDLTSLVLSNFFGTLLDENKAVQIQNKNAYLWSICRNALLNFIYYKQKDITVSLEDIDHSLTLEQSVQSRSIENFYSQHYQSRLQNLLECLRKQLSALEYQIIEMSFLQEMTSKQIAEKVNLTATNVRQKISRSLKKVRDKCKKLWLEG